MKRNLQSFGNKEFDLVIIGGGIYGAVAAWDASLRGLKVALLEKEDFGGATSSNSLKIIHGGLRYIQNFDVKRMRESIRERRILMTIAPHLVHPLPCLMPLYGHLGKGPEALRIALLLNDLVGFDRNRIDDPQKILPGGKVISREECLERLPGIRADNLTGAALWYDCFVYNSERLIISYLHSANEAGAELANYVEAIGLLTKDGRVTGVKAIDGQTGDSLEIQGRMVLNTTGPWINRVLNWVESKNEKHQIKLSWAMNIVTKQIYPEFAAGISGKRKVKEKGKLVDKGSKVYFISPWRDYSLIGTLHESYEGDPNNFQVTESMVHYFIENINSALPGKKLKREDVLFSYTGLLPMEHPDPKSGEVELTKHYHIIDHKKTDGIDGMISTIGVKYTTARDVMTKALDLVVKKLGRPANATITDSKQIFGGEIDRFNDFQNKTLTEWEGRMPEPVVKQLSYNYGSETARILRYGEEDPSWLEPIPNTTVLPAEIIHAVREEMALRVLDVLWRRTELGSAGNPGDDVIKQVAQLMANELEWDQNRIAEEISYAKDVYKPKSE